MVPEIRGATDMIFLALNHFCPFTPLTTWKMCTKNHDHMMYILPEILSFYTSVPKSWSYDHGHCTKNPDQMMYGS